MIVLQTAGVAKAGNSGDAAAGSGHSNHLAQTARRIAEDSQKCLAGSQIERMVREGDVISVSAEEFDMIGEAGSLQ